MGSAMFTFGARTKAMAGRDATVPRRCRTKVGGRSALDLPPLDLGRMLKPLGSRVEWYDEMLEGRA